MSLDKLINELKFSSNENIYKEIPKILKGITIEKIIYYLEGYVTDCYSDYVTLFVNDNVEVSIRILKPEPIDIKHLKSNINDGYTYLISGLIDLVEYDINSNWNYELFSISSERRFKMCQGDFIYRIRSRNAHKIVVVEQSVVLNIDFKNKIDQAIIFNSENYKFIGKGDFSVDISRVRSALKTVEEIQENFGFNEGIKEQIFSRYSDLSWQAFITYVTTNKGFVENEIIEYLQSSDNVKLSHKINEFIKEYKE